MAYLVTYLCSQCGWRRRRLCETVTPETPIWAYLDYCNECGDRRTFLRDCVYSETPEVSLPPIPPTQLYLMRSGNGLHKIGISIDPVVRCKSLQTGPVTVELLWAHPMENAKQVEKEMHQRFQAKRVNGEWFELGDEDVKYIKELADE